MLSKENRLGKLYTITSRRDLQLAAYYSVLLKDSSFCSELKKLLDQLDQDLNPITSKLKEKRFGLTRAQRELIVYGFRLAKTEDPVLRAGINYATSKRGLKPDTVFASCESAALTLNRFIEAWNLPFDSKIDLLHYHYQSRLKQADDATFKRKSYFDSYGDWISIPDFYYDPTQDTREWLEQQIDKVSQEIRRRAHEIENELREKGLKPLPTRWRPKKTSDSGQKSITKSDLPPKDLLKSAEIYYLRSVRKYSWGQIEETCKISRTQAPERYKNFKQALQQTIEEYLEYFKK